MQHQWLSDLGPIVCTGFSAFIAFIAF